MRPPKKINIFGENIEIRIKKNIKDVDGEDLDAHYCPNERSIEISDLTYHTIIHEMFHAMTDITGIDQTDLSQNIKEILAQNTATMMVKVFKIGFKRKDH